ncbi:S9 family peptidase, partial [Xanthomonas oryzae pv. oryzae]
MVSDARRSASALCRWRALVACIVVWSGVAQAAPSVADYQRSLGLREQWITLTENVAWPAQWQDDGRFYYRKTVPGGFVFVSADVATLQKQPAFDQARVAQGLSAATGKTYAPLRLPFERFFFSKEGER